ncbi:MAG: hypothetical protein HOE90_17605 [Bacteriovoracaceae bacterium]|jgi:hypothetical protein|nr:hypothetical protein [Bacteriovoracaceae bacterium]
MSNRKKNPLYVVTNNGKDVEQAKGALDAFIKKYGLEPAMKVFNIIMELLATKATTYPMFMVFKNALDNLLTQLETMLNMLESWTKTWKPKAN